MADISLLHNYLLGFSVAALVLLAVLVVFSPNLLRSVIFLTLFSLVMALVYLLLAAPDVAMTESSIGACISTVLLLAILPAAGKTKLKFNLNIPAIIVCLLVAGMLIYAALGLPVFGNIYATTNQHIAPYYINNTAADLGIPNIVTGVLASYRGFDTLGETFVIFTATIGVIALFAFGKRPSR